MVFVSPLQNSNLQSILIVYSQLKNLFYSGFLCLAYIRRTSRTFGKTGNIVSTGNAFFPLNVVELLCSKVDLLLALRLAVPACLVFAGLICLDYLRLLDRQVHLSNSMLAKKRYRGDSHAPRCSKFFKKQFSESVRQQKVCRP